MSDSLSIEWGDNRLVLLQGKVAGAHVNAKKTAVLTWPAEIDPNQNSEQAAEWLKGELTANGFSAKQAIVSLPRESVVIRHLELPNIPDEELTNMVKLQAATKVTLTADKYLLDYIPLPPRGTDTRDVLMTTVPTEVTKEIKKILAVAGIEITSIGVSSFHTSELVLQQQDAKTRAANQLHLAVVLAGDRVELALIRGKCALATSATRVSDDADALQRAVNAEVNRLRLSAQNLHGGLPISHVWVSPSDARAESLCEFLKGKLHCEGSCFDPLGPSGDLGDSDQGCFAAVAGHLFAEQGSLTESVNYLNPRKPVAKKDRRKLQMIMAGVGAVVLLGTGYWLFQRTLTQREADVATIQTKVDSIKAELKKGKNDLESAALATAWEGKSKYWLDQMREINEMLPGGEVMLVEKFGFKPGKRGEKLSIVIKGIARSRVEVNDLTDMLHKRGYSPKPPVRQPNNRDDEYGIEFTIEAPLKSSES